MSAISTRGLKILLQNGGVTPTPLTMTAITSAKPAEVTAANTLKNGDIVQIIKSGFPELDGKTFTIANSDATKFDLVGSDTTGSTGALDPAPTANGYADTDFTEVCAASISVDSTVPGTISTATFCDLSASIPSSIIESGNITLELYLDVASAGFKLLDSAAIAGDKRILQIVFPSNGGTMVAEGVVSSFSLSDAPLDGAAMFTASFALSTKPALRY